jgi:PiT family inorganic phosphate transporter
MTQKIEQFLDNIQMQSTLWKLLLPVMFLFLITMSVIYFGGGSGVALALVVAAMLAFYLAINIGANDVANNMGPAVGSKAITIGGAIIIAAIFEAGWAIIAWGDVVNTIKGGIIDASGVTDPAIFISIMLATLLWSAVWINIATYTKSPVSATHSVIGGLVGAGIIALWVDVINWGKIMQIVASWIISPVLGWSIAAFLLWSIDKTIMNRESRHDAAQKWVPVYVALMSGAFSGYLLLKWLKKVIHVTGFQSALFGLVVAIIMYFIVKRILIKHDDFFKNSKKSINRLFNLPLVFSAALLSFAHGANDVANAIGPFAAIYDTVTTWEIAIGSAWIPLWIMVIGALGLAIGLGVYGSTLIKTVGNEITKLNQVRAYCVALSAAITVIIASSLGLPVSSTHIAIGWIFGIWFFREWQKSRKGKSKSYLDKSMLKQIILSWIITLPASAFIAAISYTSIIYFVG